MLSKRGMMKLQYELNNSTSAEFLKEVPYLLDEESDDDEEVEELN